MRQEGSGLKTEDIWTQFDELLSSEAKGNMAGYLEAVDHANALVPELKKHLKL